MESTGLSKLQSRPSRRRRSPPKRFPQPLRADRNRQPRRNLDRLSPSPSMTAARRSIASSIGTSTPFSMVRSSPAVSSALRAFAMFVIWWKLKLADMCSLLSTPSVPSSSSNPSASTQKTRWMAASKREPPSSSNRGRNSSSGRSSVGDEKKTAGGVSVWH